jgi:hypothetical protein
MIPLSIKLKNLIVILVGMVKRKPGSTLFFSPEEGLGFKKETYSKVQKQQKLEIQRNKYKE